MDVNKVTNVCSGINCLDIHNYAGKTLELSDITTLSCICEL
jgi:hypothetical protein